MRRTPQQLADEQRTLDEWKRKLTAKGERRKRGESTREEIGSRYESPSHSFIPCRSCCGTGRQDVPPAYAQVIRVLSRDWQTTTAINSKLPRIAKTALCNRLAWLRGEGLVEGRVSETHRRVNEWRLA